MQQIKKIQIYSQYNPKPGKIIKQLNKNYFTFVFFALV